MHGTGGAVRHLQEAENREVAHKLYAEDQGLAGWPVRRHPRRRSVFPLLRSALSDVSIALEGHSGWLECRQDAGHWRHGCGGVPSRVG